MTGPKNSTDGDDPATMEHIAFLARLEREGRLTEYLDALREWVDALDEAAIADRSYHQP